MDQPVAPVATSAMDQPVAPVAPSALHKSRRASRRASEDENTGGIVADCRRASSISTPPPEEVQQALTCLIVISDQIKDPMFIQSTLAVYQEAMVTVSQLARQSAEVRTELLSRGCAEALCGCMLKNNMVWVQSQGCALLGHLSIDPSNAKDLCEAFALDAICNALTLFPDNEECTAMGCGALWNLAIDPATEAMILNDKIVLTKVLQCLEQHAGSAPVVSRVLGLLWNLTGTAEHKDDVIRAGGLAAAVQVMQLKLASEQSADGDDATVGPACALMWQLTRDCDMAKRMLQAPVQSIVGPTLAAPGQSIVRLLLDVMSKYSQKPEVLAPLYGVLANLCGPDSVHTKELMADAASVFSTSSSNLASGAVQGQLAGLVKSIAEVDTWREQLVKLECVDCIVNAMGRHPQVEAVLTACCGALCNLAASLACQQLIVSSGALSAVLDALRTLPNSECLNVEGCGLLANLTQSASCAQAALDGGAAELLVACIERHPTSAVQANMALMFLSWSNLEVLYRDTDLAAHNTDSAGGILGTLAEDLIKRADDSTLQLPLNTAFTGSYKQQDPAAVPALAAAAPPKEPVAAAAAPEAAAPEAAPAAAPQQTAAEVESHAEVVVVPEKDEVVVVPEKTEKEVALMTERERMRAARREAKAAEQGDTGAGTTPPTKAQEAVVTSPKASKADEAVNESIRKLKQQKAKAVEEEDYELAATLKKQIKALQSRPEGNTAAAGYGALGEKDKKEKKEKKDKKEKKEKKEKIAPEVVAKRKATLEGMQNKFPQLFKDNTLAFISTQKFAKKMKGLVKKKQPVASPTK